MASWNIMTASRNSGCETYCPWFISRTYHRWTFSYLMQLNWWMWNQHIAAIPDQSIIEHLDCLQIWWKGNINTRFPKQHRSKFKSTWHKDTSARPKIVQKDPTNRSKQVMRHRKKRELARNFWALSCLCVHIICVLLRFVCAVAKACKSIKPRLFVHAQLSFTAQISWLAERRPWKMRPFVICTCTANVSSSDQLTCDKASLHNDAVPRSRSTNIAQCLTSSLPQSIASSNMLLACSIKWPALFGFFSACDPSLYYDIVCTKF